MMKTRLIAMAMASLVLFYTSSCSEKEVEKPVEDTERVDALRAELRHLQELVHGESVANELAKIENINLNESAEELQQEVDKLKAMYDVSVNYQVIAVDFQGKVIPGASVTLNQNGTIISKPTNANGVATFSPVRAGYLTAVVSATGFATANYSTSLYNVNEGGINTRIALLPKSGAQADAGMFTLKGYLYANFNVADDTLGGYNNQYGAIASFDGNTNVVGPHPNYPQRSYDKITNTTARLYAKININMENIPFSEYYEGSKPGTIQQLTYEDAIYTATFDATTKQYTLKLPVSSIYQGIGFEYQVYADEFVAQQKRVVVGATFPDGAPSAVSSTIKTFDQSRHFFFGGDEDGSFNQYSSDIFAGQVFNWNLYYNEQAEN